MAKTNCIEYKRELTNDLEKEIIAFINDNGGDSIYTGIDDGEELIDVSNSDTL